MNLSAWRYYSKFYQGNRRLIVLSVVVSIAQSVIILPIVLLVRYIFDEVINAGDIKLLVLIGIAIALLNIINSIFTVRIRASALPKNK